MACRQPYLSDVGGLDGKTTTAEPAYSRLHNNFIVANYAADGGCYDNDDGETRVSSREGTLTKFCGWYRIVVVFGAEQLLCLRRHEK